jgi:galactokinase
MAAEPRGREAAGGDAAPAPAHERARHEFARRFGVEPALIARAPGRVNLIGEHTDYNDGFVLPLAIDRAVWIAFRPLREPRVRVWSTEFEEWAEFDVSAPERGQPGWAQYVKGTAWAMRRSGHAIAGWEGVICGDIPIGAGLSSSAALEVAAAAAFARGAGLELDPVTLARVARLAENEWVGVQCGIMDQLVAAAGRRGHAVLIDCRSLEMQPVPLPPGSALAVLDTATRRDLVGSAYNERRLQCETAARAFGAPALRDVSLAELEAGAGRLDAVTLRRARHVIGENLRTRRAAEAMRAGRTSELGELMNDSHRSLRDDFEVSSPALDAMVDCAREAGCFGARMTGAGFGGCVIALVGEGRASQFAARVSAGYRSRTRLTPAVYLCQATDGASVTPA